MMTWKILSFVILVGDIILISVQGALPKLTLYSRSADQEPIEVNGAACPYGVIFYEGANDFSCACMTGLWAFYEDSCSGPNLITGSSVEKCITLKQKLRKVHLLSSPGGSGETAVIFNNAMKSIILRLDSRESVKTANVSGAISILTTGTKSWGLKETDKGSCLAPGSKTSVSQHCTYSYTASGATEVQSTCTGSTAISSTKCTPFIENSERCESPNAKQKGQNNGPQDNSEQKGLANAPQDNSKQKGLGNGPGPQDNSGQRGLGIGPQDNSGQRGLGNDPQDNSEQRGLGNGPQDNSGQRGLGNGPQEGRTFLPTVTDMGGNGSSSSNISGYDENANITLNITYPEMNSEIWNYFTLRANEILNLSTPEATAPWPSATFKFLDISKQILQKTCPETYVKNGHFDLSLATFFNLQIKEYKFKDPFDDFATAQRIEDSLNVCLDQVQLYPFVDAREFATKNGSCNNTIEMGTFEAFDTWANLNLSSRLASRENEPIIETVWKIFTHAHAACFKYFDQSFNDHHRFTSVIMPIFTNEINDVWKSMTNLTKDTYSGLLGDAIKLMDGVAYCSDFSRLESDYPWDLPRPEKDLTNIRVKRSSESDLTNIRVKRSSESDLTNIRVKRSSESDPDNPPFKCLKVSFENTCK